MRLRAYYQLTKPGIIYGNLLTALAGFLLASKWHIDIKLLLGTIIGTSLVIAGACVYNNYVDRGIDKRMARTRKRALVSGAINPKNALFYATILTLLGFAILITWVNWLVVIIGLIGFVDYVALYGFAKRHSTYSTLVGSISGSMPIVAGYCAVTDQFNVGAWLLFAILTLWQMPHFYAIGLYRQKDYEQAGLPIVPVKRSAQTVKLRIMLYIVGFLVSCVLLSVKHITGTLYLLCMVALTAGWLYVGLKNYRLTDTARWGKQMFLFSLVVIMGLSFSLAIGSVAP